MGLSIAAPPGPVIAVMAAEAVRGRARRSILTGLGACTGDAVWLSLAALGFVAFLEGRPRALGALGLAGAALLLWMAWRTLGSARGGLAGATLPGSYRIGFLTVLTSPFSLAWWLASGPVLIASWGAAGIAGMFAALVAYSVAFTYALRWIGARFERTMAAVAYVSVAMLAGFGVYVAVESARILLGRV